MEHLLALDSSDTAALEQRLADLVQPAAVVWGAHDPFLPSTLGRRLHATIPGSTLEILPDVRHFLPEEAPEKLAATLTELLGR